MSDPRRSNPPAPGEWRPWRMEPLTDGGKNSRQKSAVSEPRPAIDAARKQLERERLTREKERQAAIAEARRQGYAEGFSEGREAGYQEGLAAGLKDGEEQSRKATAAALEPMNELLQSFHEALQQLDEAVTDQLVELAMETGRQLAGEALKARPRAVLELVRKLLHQETLLTGQPRLWLHPGDYDLVQEVLGEEFRAAGWSLQPDDEMTRGGCRVTSSNGELDATQESRWRQLLSQVRRPRRRVADGGSDP